MAESSTGIQTLWQRYLKHQKTADKNALVMHYLPVVKRMVLRLLPTYRVFTSYDDMLSSGVIGLMDAIERYDASSGTHFESYSAARIRGEILDSIRAQDWASDSLRRRIKAAARTRCELQQRSGQDPSVEEIAAHMGVDETALRSALEKERTFSMAYFEEMTESEDWKCLVASGGDSLEEIAEKDALMETLGNIIDGLPEKERLVISLYYYEELTQREIAKILGITEARVCQLRSAAVARMRTGMQTAWAE